MKIIVGLSGAQGAGKSTLLNELKLRGWALDNFKVSRAVQEQLGWKTLDRVMDAPETMMEFQNEVYTQKLKHDTVVKACLEALPHEHSTCPLVSEHNLMQKIVLTERTFADIFAYTALWTNKLVYDGKIGLWEAGDFLGEYNEKCLFAQKAVYGGTILLPYMDSVPWQEDPNRASLKDVGFVYRGIENFMKKVCAVEFPMLEITATSVADRVQQAEQFLETQFAYTAN